MPVLTDKRTLLWVGPTCMPDNVAAALAGRWELLTCPSPEGLPRRLREADIRAEMDGSSEKIGAKIRRATLEKVPYMAVIGQREADAATVAVRHRTQGDLGPSSIEAFVEALREEIDSKGRTSLVGVETQ